MNLITTIHIRVSVQNTKHSEKVNRLFIYPELYSIRDNIPSKTKVQTPSPPPPPLEQFLTKPLPLTIITLLR